MRITFLFCLLAFSSFGQKLKIISTANGASSGQIKGVYYSQIIGQSSSAIGTGKNGKMVIHQGFKQPQFQGGLAPLYKKEIVAATKTIQLQVAPNPFHDKLDVRLEEMTTLPSHVQIYNALGELVWESYYPAFVQSFQLTGFDRFRAGKYFFHHRYMGVNQILSIIKE
jgi:hypothetical protein